MKILLTQVSHVLFEKFTQIVYCVALNFVIL